jgi:hypothetical protein
VAEAFLAHLDDVHEIMAGVQPAGADTGGSLQLSERDG